MKPEENPDGLTAVLLEQLFHPLRAMRRIAARGRRLRHAPTRVWAFCAFVAVVGSLIYGASLQFVLPAGGSGYAALALAASAAAGWALFVPVLCATTRKPLMHIAHACLVTMIYGEGVLELGVLINALIATFGPPTVATALTINAITVALANAVMLITLTAQLRIIRVPAAGTTLLWFLILNTAGLAVFRIFYPALFPY